MKIIPISDSVKKTEIDYYKRYYKLESVLSKLELILINISFRGKGFDSFFHYQILSDRNKDEIHSCPVDIDIKKRISLLTFLTNWTFVKRAINRFLFSGIYDLFKNYYWWINLDRKLTFYLLKKHYIDDFKGDRSRVDNHIFYLKYLAIDDPKSLIYVEFLENELKNKILESGSENTISFKQHEQFQILNSKKLIKILEVLQEIKVINDWKKVYHQFSYPDGEIQEWGYEEYIELNFFIRFLEIHEIVKAPSFRNRAIQFVFKLKNGEIIDPDHLKKERHRRGISKLTRSNFKDFLLKENNNELINLANAIKNAVEEVDD